MVGRENVYFVVFEDNRVILDAMEIIPDANVITIATKNLFGIAASALRAVLRIQKISIDAVVDMEFLPRFSAIATFMTGAKSRVVFILFLATDRATHLDPSRLIYKQRRRAGCMRFGPAIKRTNSLGCFRRKPADDARTRRLTGLKTLARTRLLRPSERGQCDLLFLEEPPCFRRRQGLQFLGPPIAPMTVLPAGLLVPFAGMATQFI